MTLARVIPLPYQKDGVRMIEGFGGRALLADDMGLGKTLQCLHVLRRNPTWLPAIVVCPCSVKYHWEREAALHIGLQATVLEGTTPTRHALTGLVQHRLVVLNYDILYAWLPYLLALRPQMVFVDECQNISNPRAKRTKAVRILTKEVPHVVALSGTPLENRPAELYPAVSIVCPREFGSGQDFYLRYCAPRRAPWGWVYDGAARIPELNKRLRNSCMIRRRWEDVNDQFPPVVRRVTAVPLRNREEYKEAKRDFMGWLRRTGGPEAAKRAARAEKLAQIAYLRMLVARGKIRAVAEWIDEYLATTDQKLVVFGIHKKMLEALHRRYQAHSTLVTGDVTGRHRDAAVEAFANLQDCRIFFGNTKACGTGLDGLQKSCSTGVFIEMEWNPAKHAQGEGRLHRTGQKGIVKWFYLIAGDTIEERLCQINQTKHGVTSGVLDGEEADYEFNILDLLIDYLAQGGA